MKVSFKASVEKDLRKIDKNEREKILKKIKNELITNTGIDKQLTGTFKGLYSYKVGNYRIIYSILKEEILILRISHRKDAY